MTQPVPLAHHPIYPSYHKRLATPTLFLCAIVVSITNKQNRPEKKEEKKGMTH